MTWNEIESFGQSGLASLLFSVGDTKDINVSGETLTMEIVGFNQDQLSDGSGYAPYTFGAKYLMYRPRSMNETNTNAGSFVESDMYTYLQGTVLPNLPEEARSHIKTVNKKTGAGSQSSYVQTDAMQIFLFSVSEVAGSQNSGFAPSDEGSQYPIFSNDASRIKKTSNDQGRATYWWLRSPYLGDSTSFCAVKYDGSIGWHGSASPPSYSICFGFCI